MVLQMKSDQNTIILSKYKAGYYNLYPAKNIIFLKHKKEVILKSTTSFYILQYLYFIINS